jgi:hypothetical protein
LDKNINLILKEAGASQIYMDQEFKEINNNTKITVKQVVLPHVLRKEQSKP